MPDSESASGTTGDAAARNTGRKFALTSQAERDGVILRHRLPTAGAEELNAIIREMARTSTNEPPTTLSEPPTTLRRNASPTSRDGKPKVQGE